RDGGNSDLSRETGCNKSLSCSDRPAYYIAHRKNISVAGLDCGGRILQFSLCLIVSGYEREIESALDKLQQPAGFSFDQLLLTFAEGFHGERLAVLHCVRDQALQLHSLQARTQPRE